MQIDPITYNDLSIFQQEEEFSVFHKLNFTRTSGGKNWLAKYFNEPFNNISKILSTQQILKLFVRKLDEWPASISNGTIMVLEKFLDYNLDPLPESADSMNSYLYRLLHSPDFGLARYSLIHLSDFVRTMQTVIKLLDEPDAPAALQILLSKGRMLLQHRQVEELSRGRLKKVFQ